MWTSATNDQSSNSSTLNYMLLVVKDYNIIHLKDLRGMKIFNLVDLENLIYMKL